MPCTPLDFGNGVTGFVCSRGQRRPKCKACGRPSTTQCDYPLRGSKAGKTCDAHLCDAHAVTQQCAKHSAPRCPCRGDTVDYCKAHDELAKQQGTLPGVEP